MEENIHLKYFKMWTRFKGSQPYPEPEMSKQIQLRFPLFLIL